MTEQKSAQLETARERVSSLESQIMKKDHVFTEKKKELKLVKEEYQEKMNALDAKYTAQKAIILKLEETILDLYRYKAPANSSTQDSEKTGMHDLFRILNAKRLLTINFSISSSRHGWILGPHIAAIHIVDIQ